MSLLLEEFSNEDANKLSAALKKQKEITDAVAKALPETMENTKSVLEKLSAEIDGVADVSDIAVMAQKGDSKGLKKRIESLNTVFMRVGNLTAAVVQTMINAADNLQPVVDEIKANNKGKNPEEIEELTLTMNEFKIDASKKEEFAKIERILKAVSDSFEVPDWQKNAVEQGSSSAQKEAGGLWGTIKGFFKGLFGQVVEKVLVGGKDAFKKDLANLSLNDIVKAKKDMVAAQKALQPVTQAGSAGTTEATTGAAAAAQGAPAGAGSQQGGAPAANAQAAETGVQSAASDASKQPLGKSVLDIIRGFAEPYKDNRAVKTSLDNLVGPTRELLGSTEDQLRDALIAKWDEWNDNLPEDALKAIYGDPEAEGYEEKKIEMDNAVQAAIQKSVADNLKFESRQRSSTSRENIISESRWVQLAGIKECKR